MDRGEVGGGEFVVARGDAPEVLQPAEHSLDGVAATIEDGAEARLPASIGFGRDVRHHAAFSKPRTEPLSVEGAIGNDAYPVRDTVDQVLGLANVGCLPAREMEADRLALGVGRRVDLGGPAAARTTDCLFPLPPFPPAAQRWALT